MTDWKNVGDTVQSFATAGGILVGGVFTYFKFIKDRVYRPRVALAIEGGILEPKLGERFLVCRATITNNGATKLPLKHDGTAIIIRIGSPSPVPLNHTTWTPVEESAVLDIFAAHDWLESSESIRDEVIIRASDDPDCIYRAEFRLVVGRPSPLTSGNISIATAQIIPSTTPWASHHTTETT